MFNDVTTKYTGADATMEIVIMLAVAFVLGALARWIYDQLMYDEVVINEDLYSAQKSSQQEEPVVAAQEQEPVKPAPQPTVETVVMPYKQDDLKIIEGIGPKIEQLLHEGGITTWKGLADSSADDIRDLLRSAGERYRIHDPSTWPEQAMLAHAHKWDELEHLQDHLSGGKDLTRIYGNKG